MATFGFITNRANGSKGFDLTTRITKRVADKVVGADESGSFTITKPSGLNIALAVITLDGDQYMRHFGHKVTFDAATNTISYEPGVTISSYYEYFEEWAKPKRSRSAILVYAFVPEAS
mgnify:CR=1 FL=1